MNRVNELIKEYCPDGVEIRCLEDCCNLLDKKRKPITKAAREAGEYPYYGANGIQDNVANYIFDGTFVLVGEDGSVITKSGTPVVTWAEGKIWVNNHAHIIEEKDGLYIYGNPWSGKSLIDINTKVKLTNLVFVHRNTSPSVREVTKKEEFLYLMPHITNSSFMYNREKWNQLTNKLIEINACVLNCNISYDSVDALKQYLEETK